MLRTLKQKIRRRNLGRLGVREELHCAKRKMPDTRGGWVIRPEGLDASSVIYSFGVGTDIDFDLALIEAFGATVHAFDPTPVSIEWVRARSLPAEFVFHDYGIGARDGTLTFYPPRRASSSHFTPVQRYGGEEPADVIEAPVLRLATIREKLGHACIDLCKIDIEGGEYDVIDDLISSDTLPAQLLVEFHHNYATVPIERTLAAITRLREHGYRIFHISERTYEISLWRGASGP